MPHLPETRETLEQAIDIRFDLRMSLIPLAEMQQGLDYLREAEGLALKLDDQRRLGRVSVFMCQHLWVTGQPRDARAFGQRALAIAEAQGDFFLRLTARTYLGGACVLLGDYADAQGLLQEALQLLEGNLSRERFGLAVFPAVTCRWNLAWSLAERGAFDTAIAHGQEGLSLAESVQHVYSLIAVCHCLGHVYVLRSEFHNAIPILERALALGRDSAVPFFSPFVAAVLGYAYVLSFRGADGLALLQDALPALGSRGLDFCSSLVLAQLGEAYLQAGRPGEALSSAERGLTLARQRGERGHEAWALRLLGDICAQQDPPDVAKAEKHYREAMALADELGMRPLLAHCHLGLGTLYARVGCGEEARAKLAAAAELY